MKPKPIIAITLDFHKDDKAFHYSDHPWYALRCDYSDIVTKYGGIPIFLSYEHKLIDDVLNFADALIIPGGDRDIPPKFYGQEIMASQVRPGEERASYELELIKRALERNIPILGICNGMQILNVALGGDLIQNIPTFKPGSLNHQQPAPKNIPSHSIDVIPGTKLAALAGEQREWMVNSTHHQAIGNLGRGLIISAKAPDNIIEAIESTEHKFVIGIEWHPEYHNSELDGNLFEALVKAG